jgi:hypothetical protein
MVVPKTPTTTAAAAEFGVNLDQTVLCHGHCVAGATPAA